MQSQSFYDTELKLYRYVRHINDSSGQIVDGLIILHCPWGLEING